MTFEFDRLSGALLRQLVNSLPNPIYVKDINHRWIYVNDSFCQLLGHSRASLIGKSDYDYSPKVEADLFWKIDDEVFKSRKPNISIEKNTNLEGVTRVVESKKVAYEDENNTLYLFGILTDITELRNREIELKTQREKAEQANIAKSQFLANMSHEIRTPMNGIMGMADLLSLRDLGTRERDFVNTIQRSSNALLTIINDILDFSKIEAGQITLEKIPFNLRETIEDIFALFSSKVDGSDVDMLLRIQPDFPIGFLGDSGRVRQILLNLIGNAIKFTNEGHILIDVHGNTDGGDANIVIDVTDTGIGIPEDKLQEVFNKFTQADGSTTREYGGTGLGLTIAKSFVELMGGQLSLKSEYGQGTTFTIELTLPIAEIEETHLKSVGSIREKNILIIDDNPINCEILKEQLTFWKCQAATVTSAQMGRDFLRKAKQKNVPIHLVIVDYQMPRENGEDFIRKLKASEDFNSLPVILLSSVDKCELRDRMLNLNIRSFLTKPTPAAILHNEITRAICSPSPRKNNAMIDKAC